MKSKPEKAEALSSTLPLGIEICDEWPLFTYEGRGGRLGSRNEVKVENGVRQLRRQLSSAWRGGKAELTREPKPVQLLDGSHRGMYSPTSSSRANTRPIKPSMPFSVSSSVWWDRW